MLAYGSRHQFSYSVWLADARRAISDIPMVRRAMLMSSESGSLLPSPCSTHPSLCLCASAVIDGFYGRYHTAMGYYYDDKRPPDKEQPPGCLDALLITRAVFGVMMWPVLVMILVVFDAVVVFYMFSLHPALALIPIGITAGALWLFARWEQKHFRPPGL